MLVGPTGCGKSAAWNTLLSTLTEVDKIKGEKYIIDPKAITKDELYGKLDNTTMEWTDGTNKKPADETSSAISKCISSLLLGSNNS